ncbi:MAG: hypothetical protein NUV63_12845 [Gallionella sp.]|nr:hypothetical protein [Gallionella sp.]
MKIPKQEYTAEFKELVVKRIKERMTSWSDSIDIDYVGVQI